MINKEDKLRILNGIINNLNFHISILQNDTGPDIEGKPSKQILLNDMYNQKIVLQEELASVQSS
jgi:hypothetical protein